MRDNSSLTCACFRLKHGIVTAVPSSRPIKIKQKRHFHSYSTYFDPPIQSKKKAKRKVTKVIRETDREPGYQFVRAIAGFESHPTAV